MNEPREVLPISYAHAGEQIALDVKPLALLWPNVASVATPFLKLTTTQSPVDAIYDAVKTGRIHGNHFWDAMITAPMLLSIPLAIWTARLCINPLARRAERISVWAISASSMAMTLMCISYCVWIALHAGHFIAAVATSIMLLTVLALMLARLRPLMTTYVPALVGITGAFAIHTLLIVMVVLDHSRVRWATVVDLLIAGAQFAAMVWTVRRYRRGLDGSTFV